MRTILLNLPYDCPGFIIETEDNTCCVLNARMSREQNEQTYMHELRHLHYGDLRSELSAGEIERIRHREE